MNINYIHDSNEVFKEKNARGKNQTKTGITKPIRLPGTYPTQRREKGRWEKDLCAGHQFLNQSSQFVI